MDILKALGALTAFAGTMLLLSMVVSTLVETFHRFAGLRERGLRLMVEHVYDQAIAPHIEVPSPDPKNAFITLMTCNRAPGGRPLLPIGTDQWQGALTWLLGGRVLGNLPVHTFMERLGSSNFGDALLAAVGGRGMDAVDVVLKDLAVKFEALGQEASTYFESRSRLLSVLVAMAVAWQCYVNPYDIMATYAANPAVADAVTKQAQQALPRVTVTTTTTSPPSTIASAAGAQAESGPPSALAHSDDLEKQIAVFQQQLDALQTIGVPIGWSTARLATHHFGPCRVPYLLWPQDAVGWATAPWLLLGGLLVGLGGPFWAKTFSALLELRNGATALQAPPPAAAAGDGAPDKAATAAAHFKVAADARAILLAGAGDTDGPVG